MARSLWPCASLLAGFVLVLPQPAYAHGGVDPGQNAWLAWNITPEITIGVAVAGWVYVRGLRRWRQRSHPTSNWQKVSFFLGLFAIWGALQSPIDPLAEHVFVVHQVQHFLLRMIGPILLLLGAPVTPLLRGLPDQARTQVIRPVVRNQAVRRLYGFLIHPVVASVLFVGAMYFWQVPPFHNASIRNDLIHYFMHFTMLASGLIFWWVIIIKPHYRSSVHYGIGVVILGITVIPNTILGAMITFSETNLYPAYDELGRLWGLAPLQDQQLGALFIWIPGDMMNVIAAVVAGLVWFSKAEKEQQAQEARQRR